MNTAQLASLLRQHDPDTPVVLRDPDSGLFLTLRHLIDETVIRNGYRDYRCGPHNLTMTRADPSTPVVHLGKQGWYGTYPPTPFVETAAALATELDTRAPNTQAVVTHHFDEFADVDLLSLVDTSSPMLWASDTSSQPDWPTAHTSRPPPQALLINNTENEAYSNLRSAAAEALRTRVMHLMANRAPLKPHPDLPLGNNTVPRATIAHRQDQAARQLEAAWTKFETATQRQDD